MQKKRHLGNWLTRLPLQKRGGLFLILPPLLIGGVVVLYYLTGVLRGFAAPLHTVQAVELESGIGVSLHGYIVRNETVVSSSIPLVSVRIDEGQKVSGGQTLAIGYVNAAAQQRSNRIEALRTELSELESALNSSASVAYDHATMDASIRNQLMELNTHLHAHELDAVRALSSQLKGSVLRRNASETDLNSISARADALRSEAETLEQNAGADTIAITADNVGYFSAGTDGYEQVLTPELLPSLSPSELERLSPAAVSESSFGRIVSGETWYYAAAVDASEIADLKIGDRVPVYFAVKHEFRCDMTVSSIGQAENGKAVLTLSCGRLMQKVVGLRAVDAELRLETVRGLRVPKEAVHVRDGNVGVYVLESTAVKWKSIVILHDNGESYTVRLDRSNTSNLWPGDEIVLSADELYDGKVVFK